MPEVRSKGGVGWQVSAKTGKKKRKKWEKTELWWNKKEESHRPDRQKKRNEGPPTLRKAAEAQIRDCSLGGAREGEPVACGGGGGDQKKEGRTSGSGKKKPKGSSDRVYGEDLAKNACLETFSEVGGGGG